MEHATNDGCASLSRLPSARSGPELLIGPSPCRQPPGLEIERREHMLRCGSLAGSLAITVAACGGLGAPLGPSSLGTTYTVSGVTYETTATGVTPVEGVVIEE